MAQTNRRRYRILARWREELVDELLARGGNPQASAEAVEQYLLHLLAICLCETTQGIAPGTMTRLAASPTISEAVASACRHLFGLSARLIQPSEAVLRPIVQLLAQSASSNPVALTAPEDLGAVQEYFHAHPSQREAEAVSSRKAAGIYYTPPSLVDYLVQQTLAPLLVEQTPARLTTLTILDPACGGGAFLIGVYRYLLEWYHRYYCADPASHGDTLWRDDAGNWKLTVAERQRILTTHLYGVDRDPAALHTTRLALLCALYQGTAEQSPRPLPDLRPNLHCGDALVDQRIAALDGLGQFNPSALTALRPFDWASTFPAIMGRGGFTVVLGNPPFVSYSGRQAAPLSTPLQHYFRQHYQPTGWPAAHVYFIERATMLAQRRIALVVPDQVGYLARYARTRALLPEIVEVRYWGEAVFAKAATPIATFIADRQHHGPTTVIDTNGQITLIDCQQGQPWHTATTSPLLTRLLPASESLGNLVADIGVHTGNCAEGLLSPLTTAPASAVPLLEGQAITRYRCSTPRYALNLTYQPAAGDYFTIFAPARYQAALFVIRQTAAYPIVGPRQHALYFRNSLIGLFAPTDGRAIEYLVGLLNSRLCRYLYQLLAREVRQRLFPQIKIGTLRRLPIKRLDLTSAADRHAHDQIVASVRHLLALHAATPDEATHANLTNQIRAIDQQLDQQIYQLYGLTEAEIALVEGATS